MQVERDEAHVDRVFAEVNKGSGFSYSRAQVRDILSAAELVAARPATPGDGAVGLEQAEDDRFAREFREAQRIAGVHGSMEPYARVLSDRLRQMDKRAKAANRALVDLREQTKLDIRLARAKVEDAQQRAAAAEARAEAAEVVLRRVEWVATSGANYRCPCCGCSYLNVNGVTYSHAPDCALAATLAAPQPSGAEASIPLSRAQNGSSDISTSRTPFQPAESEKQADPGKPDRARERMTPREVAERIFLMAFDTDDRVPLLFEHRAELDEAESLIRALAAGSADGDEHGTA